MCGIAGYILFNGIPVEAELRQMGQTLGHRGPDDFGVHIDGPVGVQSRNFSNARIYSIGWRSQFDLRAGIEQTYPWVAAQVEALREAEKA